MNEGEHDHTHHARGHAAHGAHCAGNDVEALDPVCGMSVDPKTVKHSLTFEGHAFYFCSAGCRARFEADPVQYLAKDAAAVRAKASESAIWTCPMHPEIRRDRPGACPICGWPSSRWLQRRMAGQVLNSLT